MVVTREEFEAATRSVAKAGHGAYDTTLVSHLLRFVRNTSDARGGGHYGELPASVRARLEARPGGIARLVLSRFPTLTLAAWRCGATTP